MEKQDDLQLDQKAENGKKWQKIQAEDRFFRDAFRGAGFTFESSIAEIIDNSISAGATLIQINTVLQKDSLYTITIEDNGSGVSSENLKSILNLGSGNVSDYKSNSISYYGVGLKYALMNLSESGISEIKSIHNGVKSFISFDSTDIPLVSDVTSEKTTETNGFSITIPNIKVKSNKITSLLKFLGVSYFPQVANGNKLNIKIIHNKETKDVIFTDPLYRNLNNSITNIKGISVNNDEIFINGLRIKMSARFFHDNFNEADLSHYDTRQGGSGFTGTNSGVYFRLNGRYITLGDNKFYVGGQTRSGQTRIRVEVDIDRDLMQTIGINFNKSKIDIPVNDTTQPFLNKLESLVSWGVKTYNHDNSNKESDLSPEIVQEREDLNRDLNARRKKLNNDSIENAPQIKEDKKEKSGTKDRPKIGKYNKHEKQSLNIKYESFGKDKAFDYYNQNGTLLLIYNTSHEFYNKYSKMSKESKKLIDTYTIALCDSFNITKNYVPVDSDVYDIMIQTLLESFSKRLSNYNND